MKKISLFLSICILVGIVYYALNTISKENKYTSVRSYSMPKIQSETVLIGSTGSATLWSSTDTEPPIIDILGYQNKDVVTSNTVEIRVTAADNMTSSWDLIITGVGLRTLSLGYNTITVSAKDSAGNIWVKYIIIEKK